MFISEKLNDALNDQITMELAAHVQYLAIATYFESKTLDRLAAFFYNQAEEEKMHALKIVHFLAESEADVRFSALEAPRQDFSSPAEAADLFASQEQKVTDSFYRMQKLANEEGDFITHNFLQWFVDEQLEEMATANKLRDLIAMAGDNLLLVEMMVSDLTAAQSASMGAA